MKPLYVTGLFIVLLLALFVLLFRTRTPITVVPAVRSPTPIPLLTDEDRCHNNIVSDNALFEDRMTQIIKTCADTQICNYNDFRTWSTANGMYVPDWRSENYIKLKVQECLENLPTPTVDASPSAVVQ